MPGRSKLVDNFETEIEDLLARQGVGFEREEPGFTQGPRWYVELDGYLVMITLDEELSVSGLPTLSICLQSFVLDTQDGVDDLFSLLAHCARLEGVGLIGAEGNDGTRVLMLQRKLRLEETRSAEVLPLARDLIHQYETVLGPQADEAPRVPD